jgi:hypothetical protein
MRGVKGRRYWCLVSGEVAEVRLDWALHDSNDSDIMMEPRSDDWQSIEWLSYWGKHRFNPLCIE